jgi:hypothetical protein
MDMAQPDMAMPQPDMTTPPDMVVTNMNLFAPPVNYATGTGPYYVVIADTRKNGKQDILVADFSGKSVSILLGKGDGTFEMAQNKTVPAEAASLAFADFTGDGVGDIVAGQSGPNVALLIGNGDGTFQDAVTYPSNLSTSFYVAGGKIKGGANVDLVVADLSGTSISVLEGNGTSTNTFSSTSHLFNSGQTPLALLLEDFNHDGMLDIAVANSDGNDVSILINDSSAGTVALKIAQNYGVGKSPFGLATADLNKDGHADLVTSNSGDETVSVLIGKGDGTFTLPAVSYAAGKLPVAVALADLTNDGLVDAVIANSGETTITVLPGNEGGSFAAPVTFQGGNSPRHLATGQLNGDAKSDVVVGNSLGNNVSVFRSRLVAVGFTSRIRARARLRARGTSVKCSIGSRMTSGYSSRPKRKIGYLSTQASSVGKTARSSSQAAVGAVSRR